MAKVKKASVKKAQDGAEESTGLTKKYQYAEIKGDRFGIAKSKPRKGGGTKDKAIGYRMGFAPSDAKVMKQTTDSEGNVIKSKERSIGVNRASNMMRRKAGEFEFKKGGKVSKTKIATIRAAAKRNKAAGKAGKKPTTQMLKQERKIKAASKKGK